MVTFGALAPAGFTLATLAFGQAVIFGTISGVAGGVIGGAITGGLRGAALGGAFGFLGGAGFGALGHGFAKVLSAGMTMAVMGGIGLGLSYGTGGWEGLVTFGAGLAGGFVGSRIVGGLKGADAGASASAEAQDELALYADMPSDGSGLDYILRNEIGGGGGGGGRSGTKALSPYRLTGKNEKFIRYESKNSDFSKVTDSGGVKPGTYAAPENDGIIPIIDRAKVYNLPNSEIPRSEIKILSPPPGRLIIGPKPVPGGTGNEVIFIDGF